MNNRYFDILKDIYSSSAVKTIIADENFKVIWANDTEIEELILQKSALSIFEIGTKIPESSEVFSGMLDGIPYIYNVVLNNKNEEKFFVIEIMSSDMVSDLYNTQSFVNYFTKSDAEIRQAVFEISNAALNIYNVFEATESYNEICLINTQMRDCYKILSTFANIPEANKYVNDIIDSKVFNLSAYIKTLQSAGEKILAKNKSIINFEIEKDLYIDADAERLLYVIINSIISVIKHSERLPIINISIKKLAEDIFIKISNDGRGIEFTKDSESYSNKYYSEEKQHCFEMEMYIIKQFCKKFNGKLYLCSSIKGEISIGIRLPQANAEDIIDHKEFTTEFKEYCSDKFSPFYIALANVYDYDFF